MSEALFALVVTVCSMTGDCQNQVIEVYDSRKECESVKSSAKLFNADCFEVEKIVRK